MEYLNYLQIDSLKGVRNLTLGHFARINLITGPNGSGKSTVLDAIELLCNPYEPMQFLKVAEFSPDTFCRLFSINETTPLIKVSGILLNRPYHTELSSDKALEAASFNGCHTYSFYQNGNHCEQTNTVAISLKDENHQKLSKPLLNVKRISANTRINTFEHIAKDRVIKEKALALFMLFDNRFSDIYSPDFKHTYALHETYGNLDVAFFSDGLAKVLAILDAMCDFQNGILLLDDLDTHLSPQTMYEVCSLLYTLAKEKHIQLFITTHNQELIDEFLDLANFYNELSHLQIIRIKTDGVTSASDEFTGKEAYELRMEKEIDFRYEYPNERRTI